MYKFFRFEFLFNLKRPFTYVFFALMIVQGIWYAYGTNDYYGNSNTLLNSSMAVYQNLSVMGVLLIIIASVISAGAFSRDIECKTAETLYSGILNEKQYFMSKYLAVCLLNMIIIVGYPLGMLLFPYCGAGTPEQFGAVPWGQMAHAFIIFTIPNIIFLVTLSVFLVAFSRRTGVAYVGTFLTMMLVMLTEANRNGTAHPVLLSLIDPFAYTIVMDIVDGMSIAQRNDSYLQLSRIMMINRGVWIGIALLMFVAAYLKFNFKYFISQPLKKKLVVEKDIEKYSEKRERDVVFSNPDFSLFQLIKKTFRLSWIEFKGLSRTFYFRLLLVFLSACFCMNHFLWTPEHYITTSHLPLTSTMTYVRIIMMVMICFILILLAGELLFIDRKTGVWRITDAMPVPSWVLILSRFIAIAGVGFIISTLMLATGIIAQLSAGFTDIEWGLYIKDMYGSRMGWIMSVYLITMVFCVGSLTKNRLAGHVFSITIFLFFLISLDLGSIEQLRFAFPFAPGLTEYSEMNGYGVFDAALPWYTAAWGVLSIVFLIFAALFWNRGVDRTLKERVYIIKNRLNPVNIGALCILILVFGLIQYGIHDNLLNKAGYQTANQKAVEKAAYERNYKKYEQLHQPKISNIEMKLDIFPKQRKALYSAVLTCENKSNEVIDTLHIDKKKFLTIQKIMSDNIDFLSVLDDKQLRYSIYQLSKPLRPGKGMKIYLEGNLHYQGFHQSDPQADLTFNGTFMGMDILPYFGYNENREIRNNKERIKQKLPLIKSRMDDVENLFSRSNSVHSDQADFFTWDIVLSTSAGQEPVCPGKLVKSWQEDKRNFCHYVSEKPGHFNLRFTSANYSKKELVCAKVPATIFYYPSHTYNIEVIEKATKKTMEWLTAKLGKYPHSNLKIVEKLFYDDDFVTFNNITAISEKHGWTADVSRPEDEQYIYYSLARELATHWINSGIVPANVQGAQIYTQSIPEYFALLFMKEIFGMNQAAQWLEDNYEGYIEGKGEEEISEKPLLYSDDAPYVSMEKGGRILFALSHRVGVDKFNTWLASWLRAKEYRKNGCIISNEFYNDLVKILPDSLHTFAEECFKDRIQYQLTLDNIKVQENSFIRLVVKAFSGTMDGLGHLKERPFNSILEIGLFDKAGHIIEIHEVNLKSGENTYTLNTTLQPETIALDPNYWYMVGERRETIRKVNSELLTLRL